MNLSQQDIQFYNENGYLVLDAAFTQDELSAFQANLLGYMHYVYKKITSQSNSPKSFANASFDDVYLALKELDPNAISVVQRTISRSPEFLYLCSKPSISNQVKQLLGMSLDLPLYLTTNGVVFTGPSSSHKKSPINFELDWHLDIFYTIPRSQFIQWWAPLMHDATEDIGTLIICPGSHKKTTKQQFNPGKPYDELYSVVPDEIKQYKPTTIALKKGQMLIFDGRIIHRSGTNNTNLVRCSMIGMCHNSANEYFEPMTAQYKYFGQTPEAYFYEVYGDENVLPIIDEQSVNPKKMKTGA